MPDVQRADALRALELVRAERHEVGAERLDVEVDVRRGLDRVDVEERCPLRARTRATISAIGWIVPTSLLASMIETRIVLSLSAASSWSGIDPAVAVDRQLDDLEAELLEVAQRVADRVVLDGEVTIRWPRALPGPGRALERQVVRLGAAGREDDLAGLAR